jgi:hypothetical protein
MNRASLLAAYVLLGTGSVSALASVTVQTVIMPAVTAPPGFGVGVSISSTNGIAYDRSGSLTVQAILAGTGITSGVNADVLYAGQPGSLVVVRQQGAPAGTLAPLTFSGGFVPIGGGGSLSGSGDCIFHSFVAGAGVSPPNDSVLFSWHNGVAAPMFREGSSPPGLAAGSATIQTLNTGVGFKSMSDDGGFIGIVNATIASSGSTRKLLYAGNPLSPTLVFGPNIAVPGVPGGVFDGRSFSTTEFGCAAGGKIVVGVMMLDAAGVDSTNDYAIVTGTPDALQLFARTGQGISGLDPADVLDPSGPANGLGLGPTINDNGVVMVLNAALTRNVGDVTDDNAALVLYGAPGNVNVLVRQSDPVADLPAGIFFSSLHEQGSGLTSAGAVLQVTLSGIVIAGSDDRAIVSGTPGQLTTRLRSSDPAPGYPAGYTLGIVSNNFFINRSDTTFLVGCDVFDDTGNSTGVAIFATDPTNNGVVTRVVGPGDSITVAPGDTRTIQAATTLGWTDQHTAFVSLTFTDNKTGIFSFGFSSPCAPDFDGNGSLQVADIFAFLNAWFAGDSTADFDANGSLQVADIFAFLTSWFAGC